MKAKPTSIQKIRSILLAHKQDLSDKYGVREIGIFGSFAREENRKNSDIDILVELEKPMGFFKFIRLEREVSELLGEKVDLVTKNALKPHIGQRILAEVIYV
jgi:predicted nucleotidyltransferase